MTVSLLKELDSLVERKRWKTIVVYTVLLIIVSGGIGNFVTAIFAQFNPQKSMTEKTGNFEPAVSSGIPSVPVTRVPEPPGIVAGDGSEKEIGFEESEWNIDRSIEKEKDATGNLTGYYCVKEKIGFEGSEIWRKSKLKVGESVNIRFSLKSDSSIKDAGVFQAPKLILNYGRTEKNGARYRMFIPDSDISFVGFEDTLSGTRISPKHLLRPLELSKEREIEIEYSVDSLHSNEALFHYKLTYVAPVDGDTEEKQISDEGSFQAVFPWPNPRGDGAEQEFGLGAYRGTCFKIDSFRRISASEARS